MADPKHDNSRAKALTMGQDAKPAPKAAEKSAPKAAEPAVEEKIDVEEA